MINEMSSLRQMMAGRWEELSRLESDLDAVEAELDEAFELSVLVDEGWEDVDEERLIEIGA